VSGPRLYTVAYEIQDREAFRAMLARIGIDSHVTADAIALDAAGMQQLRDWFADHGDTAQADAIHRALSE
jgi:hypothetical protein